MSAKQVDEMKKQVKKFVYEAKAYNKGTCINPSGFWHWRKAYHSYSRWEFVGYQNVYDKFDYSLPEDAPGQMLPTNRYKLYERHCIHCGDPQRKRI